MAGRARKMVNLAIEETSGVDHPAHLHEGWLVMKSTNQSEIQNVLDNSLTEEDSNMEDYTTEADNEKIKKAEMTIEEAMKKIAELEAKLADSAKEESSEPAMGKSVDGLDEILKSAPESVIKMVEDLKKTANDAVEELRKEREATADAESIKKAKEWSHLSLNAEKVGPALRQVAKVDATLAKALEEVLTSVNAQAESANIFAEIGKSADFKSGDAYGRMTAMAKSAVEEGVAKSFEVALADIALNNPELYSQYLSEKGA